MYIHTHTRHVQTVSSDRAYRPHRWRERGGKNVRPAEMHRQVREVYGENAMSDGMVRRWCRMFSEERTNVHDDDRPSLVTADLLDQVS
jgi:hypothetical protein